MDVFCEAGFFSPADSAAILKAARAHGFQAVLHGDELTDLGCGVLAKEVGRCLRGALRLDPLARPGASCDSPPAPSLLTKALLVGARDRWARSRRATWKC